MSSGKVLSDSYDLSHRTLDQASKIHYHKLSSFSRQRRSSSTEKSSDITKQSTNSNQKDSLKTQKSEFWKRGRRIYQNAEVLERSLYDFSEQKSKQFAQQFCWWGRGQLSFTTLPISEFQVRETVRHWSERRNHCLWNGKQFQAIGIGVPQLPNC